jgi:hypothetical protein
LERIVQTADALLAAGAPSTSLDGIACELEPALAT